MKKRQLIHDSFAVSIFTIFSLIVILFIIPNQVSDSQVFGATGNITARTFPYLLMWVMLICSLLHIGNNFISIKNLTNDEPCIPPSDEVKQEQNRKALRTLGVFLLFLAFILLFTWFGYAVACIVVLPSLLAIQKSNVLGHYISVLVFAAIFYIIFYYVLNVNVPLFQMNF